MGAMEIKSIEDFDRVLYELGTIQIKFRDLKSGFKSQLAGDHKNENKIKKSLEKFILVHVDLFQNKEIDLGFGRIIVKVIPARVIIRTQPDLENIKAAPLTQSSIFPPKIKSIKPLKSRN